MSGRTTVESGPVSFSLEKGALTLRDEAGGGEVAVEFGGDTSLTPATDSWFDVPMDGAVSMEAESLRFPHNTAVWLRGVDGEAYGGLTEREITVESDGTFIDVSAAMKVVVYVEQGPVSGRLVRNDENPEFAVIELDGPTRLIVGVRSIHEEPTAMLTVPDDPEALMAALSSLGSSMKEWSAERSWPTLRGHPPAIEIGDELQIPDRLQKPDTGVTVAVPPDIDDILRIAPLANYFGTDVVPGDRPELRLCGHAEPLGRGRDLEQSVDELVARGLVLDSLVRIGGYYSLPRYEYEQLAPELPFYPPELSDEPIDRQLLEYLEVPFAEIEPYVPQWSATATLRPSVTEAEALPYLLNSLARIHVTPDAQPRTNTRLETLAHLSTSSIVPTGASSLPDAARRRAMAYERRSPEQAEVLLIGAEPSESSSFERTNWAYHEVDGGVPLPDHRRSVTRTELRAALQSDPLYVHYGNRVTTEGFVCSDGVLRFEDVPEASVGALSFDWNQPETAPVAGLLETATVVCLSETPMQPETADAFAKYLVLGFPPVQAARFAGTDTSLRYLGDVSLSLTDHANGTLPVVFDFEAAGDEAYRASFRCWTTRVDGLGSSGHPNPEKYGSDIPLTRSRVPVDMQLFRAELVDIAEDDYLLRFNCEPPEGVPRESILHESRDGWAREHPTGSASRSHSECTQ
jgi:hypothetical protein